MLKMHAFVMTMIMTGSLSVFAAPPVCPSPGKIKCNPPCQILECDKYD